MGLLTAAIVFVAIGKSQRHQSPTDSTADLSTAHASAEESAQSVCRLGRKLKLIAAAAQHCLTAIVPAFMKLCCLFLVIHGIDPFH